MSSKIRGRILDRTTGRYLLTEARIYRHDLYELSMREEKVLARTKKHWFTDITITVKQDGSLEIIGQLPADVQAKLDAKQEQQAQESVNAQ